MSITVAKVNLKAPLPPNAIYIGRAFRGIPASPLANPYSARDFGRGLALDLYRNWLTKKVEQKDVQILRALGEIREKAKTEVVTLMCWCSPLPCHGEIIREAAETWEF